MNILDMVMFLILFIDRFKVKCGSMLVNEINDFFVDLSFELYGCIVLECVLFVVFMYLRLGLVINLWFCSGVEFRCC